MRRAIVVTLRDAIRWPIEMAGERLLKNVLSCVTPAIHASSNNHLSNVDRHPISHSARPIAGWIHPPQFACMFAYHSSMNPHENTSTSTLILQGKLQDAVDSEIMRQSDASFTNQFMRDIRK